MAPTPVLHDYYGILGILQTADYSTIKSAYRKSALARHPDRRRNEPNATAEFQLLGEAYEHLSNPDKRRDYDAIYELIIQPGIKKDRKLSELSKKLKRSRTEQEELRVLSSNKKKDLIRLRAERDSLKGEKERIARDKVAAETWWLYVCSFMPGKSAEINQQRRRREDAVVNMIGKQRTKERQIDLKLEEIQRLEEDMQAIFAAENQDRAEIRKLEEDWRDRMLKWEMAKAIVERNRRSQQHDWAWA